MLASTIENLDILFPSRRNHKSNVFFPARTPLSLTIVFSI